MKPSEAFPSHSRHRITDALRSRLSRRIVFGIFLSIVVIEVIILVPSVMRRERELLIYLKSLSAAHATGLLQDQPVEELEETALLTQLATLHNHHRVLGGTLYREDGTRVGSFGEVPTLTATAIAAGRRDRYNRITQRYDALWEMSPLEGRYWFVVRHDAAWVGREFYAFIGRIAGLVIIISVFVTAATMVLLERVVISPVLALRRDLLQAGQAISRAQDARSLPFESVAQAATRKDELGEVVMAFRKMVDQVSEAIAERDQAEAEVRRSEEKFSKAFYSSPYPMSLSTLKTGIILEANDSFLALYGDSSDRVIGAAVADLGLWADLRDRQHMLTQVREAGFVRNQEYRLHTHAGEPRTVLYSAESIEIHGEACLLSVYQDITERKAVEEALRESEQRFRTLVDQATDALFVVQFDGRFLDVNQQACRSLGYRREELLQKTVSEIQKAVDFAEIRNDWAIAPGQAITREGIHQRQDGTQFPVEVRLGPIDVQGRRVLLALARDITERKQVEQAQARLAEIGELAAMIVHEVRNPLTTVLMGLNGLQNLELPDRAQRRLAFALEESLRLQRLLNDILLYAREPHLDLQPMNLSHVLGDVVESLQSQPIAADRTIHTDFEDADRWVMGDRDRLKQVFINLLSNACEAIEAGDRVTCTVEDIGETAVQIQIHNGGLSIPPDTLPKLMQPFFTTKPSGNGLGLAITRRLVEAHHGTLTLTSAPETGTIATVTLPQHHPSEA
ncbi:MAG: PAS domain S-box protein [Leptolyngbyaceae cyanobacterium T60_A2020_046]|nr:PAS domain S-box protein [Leptolyngbyaceae cyanobacterium T60_A2020_046]